MAKSSIECIKCTDISKNEIPDSFVRDRNEYDEYKNYTMNLIKSKSGYDQKWSELIWFYCCNWLGLF